MHHRPSKFPGACSMATNRLASLGKFSVLLLLLLQLCVFQPNSAAVHGVIVNPTRQGSSAKNSKSDNADLSTASHNSVAMPNPYTHNQQHPKYWDPNWIDYSSDQTNDERRLFNYLMRNYDTNIRPIKNSSQPINIRLGVTLAQIFDLDEKNQVLTTNIWLDQEWIDEFLTWNASDYGNITRIRVPCTAIWLPDLVLYNKYSPSGVSLLCALMNLSFNMAATKSADDYTRGYMCSRAIIEPNGNVFWPPPTKLRSTCEVDVTYFPFDDQVCKMKLGSWIYDGHQVNILNRTENVDLNNYVPNGEWDLISTKLVRNVVYYPCCLEPFPDVTITLVIRRKILYYLYNVILPCIMMSALTLLVFCLPPESGEKIALGVTVLLAFSVFMLAISEKLPETSESIPLLGIYLTVVMGITSVSIVMTVVVLNFHYISPLNKRSLPRWIKRIAIRDVDLCSGLAPPYDEYCSHYYTKAAEAAVASESTNCAHRTPLDAVNANHLTSGSPATATNTTSTNESAVNWFESPHHRHANNPKQQQPQLFQISNSIRAASQLGHKATQNNNNKRASSSRVSKSKWMGQVDRLAASIFSGSGVSAGKHNKVHSSERINGSVEASGNWTQSVAGQASRKQANLGQETRYSTASQLAHSAMKPSSGNSSAFQQFHQPRATSSLVLPTSYDSSTISGYNREMLQRSTMLSTLTPYFLCAASRVIDSNRMATIDSGINQALHHRGTHAANERVKYSSRHQAAMATYSQAGRLEGPDEELDDDEVAPVHDMNSHPHFHYAGHYNDAHFGVPSGGNHSSGPSEFSSPPPPPPKQAASNENEQEVMQILRYLMHRQETEDDCTRRIHEWRQLSMFVDKVLFWIFTIVTLFTSVMFLLIIPIARRGF